MRLSTSCASLALVLLLQPGCTGGKKVAPNPNFTYQIAREGGFVIAGVSSLLPDVGDPLALSNAQSTALQRRLSENRKDLRLVAWGEFRHDVGDSLALCCLDETRERGSLDSTLVHTLGTTVGQRSRFLIISRIERNFTSTHSDDVNEEIDGKTVTTGTTYTTERCATVAFTVYDLTTSEWVWGTAIDGRVASSRTEASSDDDGGFFEKVLDTIVFGGEASRYPEPPGFETALDNAFETFSWQLPKEK